MSDRDRWRWNARYAERPAPAAPSLPAVFAAHQAVFPRAGTALELACGTGAAAVWLARRGLDVRGVDVSDVAIERARALAEDAGVTGHCRFDVWDLDLGLPAGDPVDVLLCHRYYDPAYHDAYIEALAPGGLLAICVLIQAGGVPSEFRAAPGKLHQDFMNLQEIASGEGDGQAWLLARKP